MKLLSAVAAFLAAVAPLCAVETKTWTQNEMADFDKGSLTNLSLASDGRLTLAPSLKEILDPSVTFLWAAAVDSKGTLFAGGGGLGSAKAKLIAVDARGQSRTVAELDGMSIQAIAIDKQDRVYAATAPDGKVYRVGPNGKAEVFYDPKAKYIWALAFSHSGDLFIATGDQGEIHRVKPDGTGTVFFRTEESHARSLAIDSHDDLIVGTEPSGLILRVTPAGAGFVLYQAPKREITAVAVAPDGTIYAAGVGTKIPTLALPLPAPITPPSAANGAQSAVSLNLGARGAALPPTFGASTTAITGGSEIYRVDTDGDPRRIWSHSQDLVYALAFDREGRVIAGTGNHGAVYRLDSDHLYTRLLSVAPTQVTSFCTAPNGSIYLVTGNIGKIFSMGPGTERSGMFESDVFDAGEFSHWGRLSFESNGKGKVAFETRSGNLNRAQQNWSPWATLDGATRIVSPSARFVEYKATLTSAGEASPEVTEVDVAYLEKNVAPVIEDVESTPANYKFPAPTAPAAPSNPPLTLPPLGHRSASGSSSSLSTESGTATPAMTWAKGQIGVRWLASDVNGDTLTYSLEIRGVNEKDWKPLREKLREPYYSWDSTAYPDGKYVVRVTASDAPSNPPGHALSATIESDPFLIDNASPHISLVRGRRTGAKVQVEFEASDALSNLEKAQYSVNGGDWMIVEPTTRLNDSPSNSYRFTADAPPGEVTIAVRVSDEYENEAVAKTVVK